MNDIFSAMNYGDKKIAIIDADLIGRKNHRFPNLACMKISSFYKRGGGIITWN